jgi:hypothetical protein
MSAWAALVYQQLRISKALTVMDVIAWTYNKRNEKKFN